MSEKPSRARPPRAARRPLTSRHHGIARVDDYAWLRSSNWQAVMRDPALLEPEIRSYLEAENAYTKAIMAGTEPPQEALFAEMKGRIKEDDVGVPLPMGPSPTTRASSSAASIRSSVERPGTAGRSRFSSTAMRWPSPMPISASPASSTAPTTAWSLMLSIPRARSSTRSKSSRPAPAFWSIPASPTVTARSNGPPTAGTCSISGSTMSTARAACCATRSARTLPTP